MSDFWTLKDSAAELGWSEDRLFMQLLDDGLVLPHPSGVGYLRYPNSVMGGLGPECHVILQEDHVFAAWERQGCLTLVSSVLVPDEDTALVPVWETVGGRALVSDTSVETAGYLFRQARIRIWR